jgi:hypothetical protein
MKHYNDTPLGSLEKSRSVRMSAGERRDAIVLTRFERGLLGFDRLIRRLGPAEKVDDRKRLHG